MPLAPNVLLQSSAAPVPKSTVGNASPSAVEPVKTGGSSFSSVYAKESAGKPASAADTAPKAGSGKAADSAVKRDTGGDTTPATPAAVADSGKPLPDGKPKDGVAVDQDVSSPADAEQAVDLIGLVPQPPLLTPPVLAADAEPEPVPVQPEVDPSTFAAVATAAGVQPQQPVQAQPPFDPEADPLDELPAVRLAMEHGGHVSASSQSPVRSGTAEAAPTTAQSQAQASGVAMLVDQKTDTGTSDEGGEKTFKGLVDDGLKDLKSAASDTRVDDFANRLAALTQAAVPKTANALPVNQPLAMHQSGWSEEVVNRVMYLSSANLKSADIQLEPAELGRLDIRVNMTVDQPAQVSFVSGHAGVREALEGQMFRLREMFAQQGMGQVDVNVSDQSRNWQGPGQEQQGQNRNTSGGGRLESGADEELSVAGAAEAGAASVVLGSSAVDYYA